MTSKTREAIEELKPCPFCGGRAEYRQGHYTGYVMCLRCEVMGPNIVEAEAIAAWNRRASLPAGGLRPTEMPADVGLGKQVRPYDETLSAFAVMRDAFFPAESDPASGEAEGEAPGGPK